MSQSFFELRMYLRGDVCNIYLIFAKQLTLEFVLAQVQTYPFQ